MRLRKTLIAVFSIAGLMLLTLTPVWAQDDESQDAPVQETPAQDEAETHTILNEETAEMISEGRITVAILDFDGRGINQMEAATLTDRLMTELSRTDAVIIVERNQMQEILEEQGFQQSGCTSAECAAEVGALLGVQNMISGSFGKLGETYTIDAKMFSVESGATIKAVSKSYVGKVDGLITEIEILAWELVGLMPPEHLIEKQKGTAPQVAAQPVVAEEKKSNWMLWTVVGLAVAGGGAYLAMGGDEGPSTLPEPPTLPE